MEEERRFIDGSINRSLTMLMACAERILAAAALICANKGAAAVIRCTYIGGGYNMEEDEERRFIEHGSVVLSSTM